MLIFGAGGFAKEVLNLCKQEEIKEVVFFDEINNHKLLFSRYKILKDRKSLFNYLNNSDNLYVIGIGGTKERERIFSEIDKLNGKPKTLISANSFIGQEEISIGSGSLIFDGVCISNNVQLGKFSIVYYNSVITHDCIIGDFVQISPSCNILGGVEIGSFTFLGSNCTILPGVKIGRSAIIGAGAVVNRNVLDNEVVVGVPAQRISKNKK